MNAGSWISVVVWFNLRSALLPSGNTVNLADFIVFMKDGKVIEMGDVSILDNPKTPELKRAFK